MGEEKSPDLLLDQFRFPGTEDSTRSALVRLELIEHKFHFPALMICRGKLDGRDFLRVSDIRDQGVNSLIITVFSEEV
jgi:hypothetical protein